MSEKPKIVRYGDKPEIIEKLINPKTIEILKASVDRIDIGEEFFNHYDMYVASNVTVNDWFTIADAQVRIVPAKGCDRISITRVHTIVASFPLFYREKFLLFIKTIYTVDDNKVEITNFDTVITTINSKICPKCTELYEVCEHSIPMSKMNYNKGIDMPELIQVGMPPNSFLMEDMTEEEMLAPTKEETEQGRIDYNKYEPVINSLVTSYKMKNPKLIRQQAHDIIRQNPNITEEELVKQIFQGQSRI